MRTEQANSKPGGHPIRVVANRTGLSPEVLRIWEKRYSAVEPTRTATGRRLYSDEDIERLRLLRQATLSGRRVGEVAGLSTAALTTLIQEDEAQTRRAPPATDLTESDQAIASFLREAMNAVHDLDAPRLEAILTKALMATGTDEFIDRIATALLRSIGSEWKDGRLEPHQEHVATAVIRQIVSRMLIWTPLETSAPSLVVGTPAGQRHELGALLVAAAALSRGWRVVYLGPDLPAKDIARAAERAGADLVALSIVYPADDPTLGRELRDLRECLPGRVGIVVGGAAALFYTDVLKRIRASVVGDIGSFRVILEAIRAGRSIDS